MDDSSATPELQAHQPAVAPPPALPVPVARIADFWPRLAAFVVDWLLLAAVGYLAGLVFFAQFVRLFEWGRPIGFTIALLYFGILGSSLGGGQTLGKRLLKIKVIDERGGLLPLPWSMVRFAIFALPFFLNCWMLPAAIDQPVIGLLMDVVASGLSGAIVYLAIFNRRTRQSLHDLAIGSFVVRAGGQGVPAVRKVWWFHWVIVVLWLICALALRMAVAPKMTDRDILAARQDIQQLDHVRMALVVPSEIFNRKSLIAVASLDAAPQDFEKAAAEVAETLVAACPQRAPAQNVIVIQLRYGYDLGLCWSSKTFQKIYMPSGTDKGKQKEWDKLIKGE